MAGATMARRVAAFGWLVLVGCPALTIATPAMALTAVEVGKELDRIDINGLGASVRNVGDQLQIETAPGTDGLTDRMSVTAATRGSNPNWFTFALRNASDVRAERWLTADRYSQAGSGILWPRLDARQIEAVTPSVGFLPENLALDGTDAFRLTLEPGQTVTFAVELAPGASPRLSVWRALDYERRSRNKQLLYGVLLGITGLLAVFLSAVFAANHKIIFPAAALFTWCVLAYLCVDFGFWHKLFAVRPEDNAQYRAATEAGVAATLLIFTYSFLRLSAWHGFARLLVRLWIFGQLVLVAVAFIDPRLADTFARLSMGGIFALATVIVVGLALRGQDRALSLVPVWMLLGLWITGMAFVFAGRIQTDAAVTALTSGLVLIVLLIGFTVTQYAFRTVEPVHALGSGDQGLRLLALENSGAAVWEWSVKRDEITVGPALEAALGLASGDLHAPAQVFLDRMHPVDRDRMRQALDHLKETGSGDLRLEFRMRNTDNDYRWFVLEAATDPAADRRRTRCIGLVRETTDSRSAQERFDHDAVHDAVTNLPNRALFLDRLGIAVTRAKSEPLVQPTVIVIDVDRFQTPGAATQHFEADGLLITLARRISHLLGHGETLARIGSNQFGVLLLAQRPARELHMLADSMRIAVRSLIKVGGIEITPTAAIGYAVYDRASAVTASDVLDDAEIAMHRARRQDRDTVQAFTPDLRTDRRERSAVEAELRQAIEKRLLNLQYQPIYAMRTQQIAGYEAVVKWDHPRLGKLDPATTVPFAEKSDLPVKLAAAVIAMAVDDLKRWHAVYDRAEAPLTVSVNVISHQVLSSAFVKEVTTILAAAGLPKGCLRLEVTEALVMENPEHASNILGDLAASGAGLSLDDFGTGYSSLTYLNIFPFDAIKIDHALVQGSSEAGNVSAILRSVVALAHELGKKVVAEGIDNEQDAVALRALGCEYAQGSYYELPQSAREVTQALKDLRKSERRAKPGGLFKLQQRMHARQIVAAAAASDQAATAATVAAAPVRAVATKQSSKLAPAARLVARQTPRVAATARPGMPPRMPAPPAAAVAVAVAPPRPPLRHAPPPMTNPAPPQQQTAAMAASASLAELGAQMAMGTASQAAPAGFTFAEPNPRMMPASMRNAPVPPAAPAAAPIPPQYQQPPLPAPTSMPGAGYFELPPRAPLPAVDLSMLPPGIAASLALLAGQAVPAHASDADDAAGTSRATNADDPLARFMRPATARRG